MLAHISLFLRIATGGPTVLILWSGIEQFIKQQDKLLRTEQAKAKEVRVRLLLVNSSE